MKAEREDVAPDPLERLEELAEHGQGGDGERSPQPDRRLDPVEEGRQGAAQTPKRKPCPDVGTALLREGGAQLGDDEPGRDEEGQGDDEQPGQRLCAPVRNSAQRVDDDDRRDQQADRVEAAELAPQLRALRPGAVERLLGLTDHRFPFLVAPGTMGGLAVTALARRCRGGGLGVSNPRASRGARP